MYLSQEMKQSILFKIFCDAKCSEAYILDKNNKLLNKVSIVELLRLAKKYLKDLKINILKIHENNILETIEDCKKFIGESIPVVDSNGVLIGIFSENDLFKCYSRAQKSKEKS